SWYSWKYQIDFLVKKGYHVVAFDMPGYGETKVEDKLENFTFKSVSEDIHHIFTQHFKQNKVIIIGHDWGSSVGWELAYRYPENIIGYVSLSIPYFPTLSEPKTERQKAEEYSGYGYQVALGEGNVKEFDKHIERFIKSFYYKKHSFDFTNYAHVPLNKTLFEHFDTFDTSKSGCIDDSYLNYLYSQFKIQGTKGPTNWYRTSYLNGLNDKQKPHLNVEVKSLQIIGANDSCILVKDIAQNYLKNASTVILEGGHWIHYFDYEEVTILIENFLKEFK
ncbi:alpha/beta-hydrolase, partial [Neoconidiobolus thromboides FSU 785]